MQVSLNQEPAEWNDQLLEATSALFQLLAKRLCQFVIGAAKHSSSKLLQRATCHVVRFRKGSVWADTELTTLQDAAVIPTNDEVSRELTSGATDFAASGEINVTYAFNVTTLQVQTVTTTTEPPVTTTTTRATTVTATKYRVYSVVARLYTGLVTMEWQDDLANNQSVLYANISKSFLNYMHWAAEYSGSEYLRGSNMVFKKFERGSVYSHVELQTQSSSARMPEEVASYLLLGSKNYVASSGVNVNTLVWFGNATAPSVYDTTPRTTCLEYNSTCSTHGRCVDTLNGHLCLCNTMWRDANPNDPGTNCVLSVGAIVLILALIILVGFIVAAVVVGTVRAKQFRHVWT
ncbi:hypothetical protein D915_010212 [Fasciola hepatica]|uniref:EGF-like domain-containing protein n=1 Tax=Fasciola hepatica TaxID=6192 RepID=A0A2H1BTQ7_FASHE|nr:hypothetical protein D915_010212 [Fasciola hepatica]